MTKVIRCNDIFNGCSGRVSAETEDEVVRLAAAHAKQAHGLETLDEAVVAKVKAAVRTE